MTSDLITVRPMQRRDVDAVAAFVDALDAPSQRLRFFREITSDLEDVATALVDAGTSGGVAMIAEEAGHDAQPRLVGMAHSVALAEPGVAEFAIVVEPGKRRRGLGSRLALETARRAVDAGIATWIVHYLPDNWAIRRLLRSVADLDREDEELGVVVARYMVRVEQSPWFVTGPR